MVSTKEGYDFVTQESLAPIVINGQIAPLRSDKIVRGEDIAFLTEGAYELSVNLEHIYGNTPTIYKENIAKYLSHYDVNSVRTSLIGSAITQGNSEYSYHNFPSKSAISTAEIKNIPVTWNDFLYPDWYSIFDYLFDGKFFLKSDVTTPELSAGDKLDKSHIDSLFTDLWKPKYVCGDRSCESVDYYWDTEEDVYEVGSSVRLFPSGGGHQCMYAALKYETPPSMGNRYDGSHWRTSSKTASFSVTLPYCDALTVHPVYCGWCSRGRNSNGTNPYRGQTISESHFCNKAAAITPTKSGNTFSWGVSIHDNKNVLSNNLTMVEYSELSGGKVDYFTAGCNLLFFILEGHIGNHTR